MTRVAFSAKYVGLYYDNKMEEEPVGVMLNDKINI